MRILKYEQTLLGGFTVTSCDKHHRLASQEECLPIKLYRIDQHGRISSDFHGLEDAIHANLKDDLEVQRDWQKRDADILCGRDQEWVMTTFTVYANMLVLVFYSSRINECRHIYLDHPYGSDIRFVLPHRGNKPDSIYDLSLFSGREDETDDTDEYGLRITECLPEVRREIEFCHATGMKVCVTEYTDF